MKAGRKWNMRKTVLSLTIALTIILGLSAQRWINLPLFTQITIPPGILSADGLFRGARRYNNPEFDDHNGKWIIRGKNSPSGVFFDFEVDPKTNYHLIIKGRPIIGRTNLRIRKGKSPMIYHPAPDGERRYIITEVEKVEVLLYADENFGYLLEEIKIEPCTACKTNKDLKQLILTKKPQLLSLLRKDRTAAARILLDWAANNTDWDNDGRFVAEGTEYAQWSDASQIYYELFLIDRGSVYCGGASVFYDRILKMFGYNSFTIDFGDIRDGLTHVTVVVPLQQDEKWDYYIFDPTFNATFTDNNMILLSIFQILDRMRNERHDEIIIRSQSLAKRDFIIGFKSMGKCPILKRKLAGFAVCSYPDYGFETYLSTFEKSFVRNGYSSGQKGFFQLLETRIFSVGNSGDPFYRKDFLSKIKKIGIPIE